MFHFPEQMCSDAVESLPSTGGLWEEVTLPSALHLSHQSGFSTVDAHAAAPLAPSDRLLGCLWLRLGGALRRRRLLLRRLGCNFRR